MNYEAFQQAYLEHGQKQTVEMAREAGLDFELCLIYARRMQRFVADCNPRTGKLTDADFATQPKERTEP